MIKEIIFILSEKEDYIKKICVKTRKDLDSLLKCGKLVKWT